MQFRLRYQAHDFELPPGEFVIGRSDECQLALDDPLVSRRHAILRVTPLAVIVVDLGSRNGVVVNGQKIKVERRLKHSDKITIGGQDMVLHFVTAEETAGAGGRALSQTLGDISLIDVQRALANDAVVQRTSAERGQAATAKAKAALAAREVKEGVRESAPTFTDEANPPPGTKPGKLETTFRLLSGVADKALGMGRSEEAERILGPILAEILSELERKKPVERVVVDRAAAYATKLGAGTQKGSWVDYVFAVYLAQKSLLPAPVVDELYTVVRRVKSPSLKVIREYIAVMRLEHAGFSATERFLFQRIEGIEQLCALK